jgi:hypothetical protein
MGKAGLNNIQVPFIVVSVLDAQAPLLKTIDRDSLIMVNGRFSNHASSIFHCIRKLKYQEPKDSEVKLLAMNKRKK